MSRNSAKSALRKSMRQALLQLSSTHVAAASQLIHAHVTALPAFQRAQNVSIFLSMDTCEPHTLALAQLALAQGKSLYVPRCQGHVMDMVHVPDTCSLLGLARNAWGIPEPSFNEPAVDPALLDFVLVPGVAFDKSRNRCGHGRGYYDHYLPRLAPHAVTCAICLDEQVTNDVPADEHDAKPHILITPKGIVMSDK